jgi:hypothetical protein
MVYYYSKDELYHHGKKGMKWGRRLYQNPDGSLTPLGRIRYGYKKKQAMKKRQQTIETKKKTAAEIAAEKDRILKSRSAAELYKNAHLFSDQELNQAYQRLNLERNIKNLIPAEVSKGKEFVKKATDTTKTVGDLVNNTTNLYNNVAKVYNSIPELNGGDKWPIIDGGKNDDNKKK